MLVFTTGSGVHGFTYDPSLGEYFLSHPEMKIPEEGSIYSINEGSYNTFTAPTKAFIEYCREKSFSGRYIGSLVADFHRNLLKGGIYAYPATEKAPNGKLRLMYECSSLAFIVEQAGGMASTGTERIMELKPSKIHEQAPIFIGSKKMVEKVESLYKDFVKIS